MPSSAVSACLLALFASAPTRASTVTLSFPPGAAEKRVVEGSITAKSIDGRAVPVVRTFFCEVQGACKVDLGLPDEHRWILTVGVPGYWTKGPLPAETSSVEMRPAAKLRGTAVVPKGAHSPGSILVRFSSAADSRQSSAAADDSLKGEAVCPIREGSFECDLPAGLLDFSLRARGHVSIYRWSQRLTVGKTADIGRLSFRPGASLVGHVTSPDRGAPKAGVCRVRLETGIGSPKLPATAPALPSTSVDDRGFFHLEVIPPGKWDVVVEQEGFAPARQPVSILEGAEAALMKPIVLSRPVRLEVMLDPPQDPDGSPWRVQLIEMNGDRIADMTADTAASLGGAWVRENLGASRRYVVRVLTGSRQRWWADDVPFSVEGTPFKKRVFLEVEPVSGRITLGGRPLRSRIVFGKENRNVSVSLESNEEGTFSGFLPRLGSWPIAVTADAPTIRRELDVDVKKEIGGHGVVEIALSDRALQGEIVLEDESPAPKAILSVVSTEKNEHVQNHVEGGTFRLDGFEPGDYILSAEGPGLTSDGVRATLPREGDASPVRIVLRKEGALRLRVVAADGSGIIGAAVRLVQDLSSGKPTRTKRTDAYGRVSFPISPRSDRRCVMVVAPPYAIRLLSLPVTADEQTIEETQGGGVLTMEYPAASAKGVPLLQHAGCTVHPSLMALATRRPEGTVENLEPGQYQLCILPPGSLSAKDVPCAQGWLPPFGKLDLAALASPKKN